MQLARRPRLSLLRCRQRNDPFARHRPCRRLASGRCDVGGGEERGGGGGRGDVERDEPGISRRRVVVAAVLDRSGLEEGVERVV